MLIGKPDTAEAGGKIETLLEQLRHAAALIEQIETFERQRAAAEKLQTLNEAAGAGRHADRADQLAGADPDRREPGRGRPGQRAAASMAEQTRSSPAGEAESRAEQRMLAGQGESQRILQIGLSEASVLMQKIAASATRGSTRWRWWPSTCRRAASRWCPSACSSAAGGNGSARRRARGSSAR